jgi:hypothetical protein
MFLKCKAPLQRTVACRNKVRVIVWKSGYLVTSVSTYGLLGNSNSNRMQCTSRPCKAVGTKPSQLELHQDVKHAMWHSSVASRPSSPCPVLHVLEYWTYVNSIFGPSVGRWITARLLHHDALSFLRISDKEQFFNIPKQCAVLELSILSSQPFLSRLCLYFQVAKQTNRIDLWVRFNLSRWAQLYFNHNSTTDKNKQDR